MKFNMHPVESSQIAAIGHDAESSTLAIRFKAKTGPGSLYHYANVTAEQFEAFRAAPSIGSHFGVNFKNVAAHPFVKINETVAA
jgi:KTSC domain